MYRLLATTVLAGVGVLFSHPALAQVVTFPAQTPGTLVQPAGNFHRLETGTNATVTVSILGAGSATVQVSAPTFVFGASPDPDGTTRTATVTFAGGSATSEGGPVPFPTGVTILDMSMAVDRPAPNLFTPGVYGYQVVVTVTAAPL